MKAKLENGTVKIYNLLPTVYENIINFRKSSIEVQQEKGFFDVVEPVKTVYQRYGGLLPEHFDSGGKVWIKVIVDFSQQEIDTYDEQQLDSDESAIEDQQFTSDGEQLYRRIRYEVRRRYKNNVITEVQFNLIKKSLRPAVLPLKDGDWDIAKELVDALTEPANAQLLAILNVVKNKIDTYILENNI